MNKRQLFLTMLTICCGLIACVGLSSCGDDDDDNNNSQDTGDNRKLYSAEIVYKVSLGKNELDAYDVNVRYLDDKSQEYSMAMKDTAWTWKCNLTYEDELPKNFELRVKPERKENLNLDVATNYEVGVISKIIVKVKNKAGRVICDCDGLGLQPTGFSNFTGEQLNNPLSSIVSGWFDQLTNTNKMTCKVYSDKIVYNKMTQKYW